MIRVKITKEELQELDRNIALYIEVLRDCPVYGGISAEDALMHTPTGINMLRWAWIVEELKVRGFNMKYLDEFYRGSFLDLIKSEIERQQSVNHDTLVTASLLKGTDIEDFLKDL